MRSRKAHDSFSGPKQRKRTSERYDLYFGAKIPKGYDYSASTGMSREYTIPTVANLLMARIEDCLRSQHQKFSARVPLFVNCQSFACLQLQKKTKRNVCHTILEHFSNVDVTSFWRHRGTVWLEQRPRPPTFTSRDNCDTFSTTNVSVPRFGMVQQDHVPQFQAEANHPIESSESTR